MSFRLGVFCTGSLVCSAIAYRLLDYHYVKPMTKTDKPKYKYGYFQLPITARNRLDYSIYSQILSDYVIDGKVKYVELRKSMMRDFRKNSLFIEWINVLARAGPNQTHTLFKTPDDELIFYINAYNALCIYGVIYHSFYWKTNHYLINSVMDVKSRLNPKNGFGFFKAPMYVLDANPSVSLDYLEHKILRKKFKDCRIHCVLNCASNGCPKLQSNVININDLDNLCKEFVNNQSNVYIDTELKKIKLSKIFSWYKDDFEYFYDNKDVAVDVHPKFEQHKFLYFIWYYSMDDIKELIIKAIMEGFDIEFYDYDWSLNNYSVEPPSRL